VTACFLGLFLFSHVVLMFCHYVLLDEVVASWENFSCFFLFYESLNPSALELDIYSLAHDLCKM